MTATPTGASASTSRTHPCSGNKGSRVAAAMIIATLITIWFRGESEAFSSTSMSKLCPPAIE